jgi:putative peptidoglycan lipid II flippase
VGSISLATFFSRLLGYVRDALVAYAFGGGVLTAAFYAAFRIPNLFRRLLGEGSLTAAFVRVFP